MIYIIYKTLLNTVIKHFSITLYSSIYVIAQYMIVSC